MRLKRLLCVRISSFAWFEDNAPSLLKYPFAPICVRRRALEVLILTAKQGIHVHIARNRNFLFGWWRWSLLFEFPNVYPVCVFLFYFGDKLESQDIDRYFHSEVILNIYHIEITMANKAPDEFSFCCIARQMLPVFTRNAMREEQQICTRRKRHGSKRQENDDKIVLTGAGSLKPDAGLGKNPGRVATSEKWPNMNSARLAFSRNNRTV